MGALFYHLKVLIEESYKSKYTLLSNEKIIVNCTKEEIQYEIKKLKKKLLEFEQAKMRKKHGQDLERDKQYRKLVDKKLSEEFVKLAEKSDNPMVWEMGAKLKAFLKTN